MRSSEWLALLYFVYLGAVCWLRPVPMRRRAYITPVSFALAAVMPAATTLLPPILRDWLPLAYVSVAYFLTAHLFVAPSARLEAWLIERDRRWFGDPTTRFSGWPAWLIAWLDVIYMLCFALLPGGFAALALTGHSAEANRYWTMVLAADLGAFAPLSVFQTRPPWQLERPAVLAASRVHALATRFVKSATTGVNTFPSGHVAVTIAVAIGVFPALPAAGIFLLVCAASIAVACVVGRYHYAMDVVFGAVLGVGACALVAAFGA